LRTLGSKVYIALAGVWIVAVIALSIMIGTIAASQAINASVQKIEKFSIDQKKVFSIGLTDSGERGRFNSNRRAFQFGFDTVDGEEFIKYYETKFAVGSTTDSVARVEIIYKGKGDSFEQAKTRARAIQFEYKLTDSSFIAADYFTLPTGDRFIDPDIEVMIYLPEGTKVKFNARFGEKYRSRISNDAFNLGNNIEYTYQIKDGKAVCLDCPVIEEKAEEQKTETDSLSKEEAVQPENNGKRQNDGNDGISKNEATPSEHDEGWITTKTDVTTIVWTSKKQQP
jgi:hypothetical protein